MKIILISILISFFPVMASGVEWVEVENPKIASSKLSFDENGKRMILTSVKFIPSFPPTMDIIVDKTTNQLMRPKDAPLEWKKLLEIRVKAFGSLEEYEAMKANHPKGYKDLIRLIRWDSVSSTFVREDDEEKR